MTIDHEVRPSDCDERAIQLMRRGGDLTLPPPSSVWDGLMRALRADGVPPPEDVPDLRARGVGSSRARAPRDRRRRTEGGTRRWGSPFALLAAAAAGALVVAAGDWVLDRDRSSQEAQVLAFAGLGPVPGSVDPVDVSARAEVVAHDGRRVLRVDLDEELPALDGYLEVWLLRPDVSGMVTLGVLEGDHAELLLPDGVSLEEYPVVDVSIEAVDGDPAHGGRSLLRGELSPGEEVTASGITTPGGPTPTATTARP